MLAVDAEDSSEAKTNIAFLGISGHSNTFIFFIIDYSPLNAGGCITTKPKKQYNQAFKIVE